MLVQQKINLTKCLENNIFSENNNLNSSNSRTSSIINNDVKIEVKENTKLLKKKKIRKSLNNSENKVVTECQHIDRKHYAKVKIYFLN